MGECYRTRDYYRYYNLVKPSGKKYVIDECLYSKILQDLGTGLFDVIAKEGSVKFPYRMGGCYLRRIEVKPVVLNQDSNKINKMDRIVGGIDSDGNVKILRYVAPVDWKATKAL